MFAGRHRDLDLLGQEWKRVAETGRGRAIVVTGRRRVGKSRLVQEFVDHAGCASVVFQATRRRHLDAERAEFLRTVAETGSPGGELVAGVTASDWNQALRMLALALPSDAPSIVVLDEVPWLMEQDPEFEGALQTTWDRNLSALPVLLLLVGSDASVMEALQRHDRAFYGRAAAMTVEPLNPADVQEITALGAAEAIDAWLITGGFPEVAMSWPAGASRGEFLAQSLANPLSPLLVSAQLTLMSEFAEPSVARAVLEAVGAGERSFSAIANAAGGGTAVPSGSLGPVLKALVDSRVLAVETPLSTVPDTRNKRYRVADPYLRFWLAFGPQVVALAERGRADVALARIERSWTSWRGRAVEPLVRECLARLLPDARWPDVMAVGGWWNRANNPEIDLVGADHEPVARQVCFAGSIKWREDQPFSRQDFSALARSVGTAPSLPDDAELVVVSRAGVAKGVPAAAAWGPEDLVAVWR